MKTSMINGQDRRMNAVQFLRYGGPEELKVVTLPIPRPKADEVLVKMVATSVNPLDTKIRDGGGGFRFWAGLLKPRIKTLGFDIAGTIEAVGPKVFEFKIGDRVFGMRPTLQGGANAEYVCMKVFHIAHAPLNIDLVNLGAVPLAALTALQGLRDLGGIKSGSEVLINGASGGVGTFAVQIAKILGGQVTAVCSAKNHELVKSLGADLLIDYRVDDFTKGKARFSIIFDVASTSSFFTCQPVLKEGGIYFNTVFPQKGLLGYLSSKIIGSKRAKVLFVKSRRNDLEFLANLLREGKLKPIIDRYFSLASLSQAHSYCEQGLGFGKVIVKIP